MFGEKTLAKICAKQYSRSKQEFLVNFRLPITIRIQKQNVCNIYTINLTRLSLFERNTCSMYTATYCKLKESFI